ncbi:MAG: stage II sporulation protein R [Clostridia bacterium]|nr:stage II sporulation protein R [Clostridia bacterium]
MRKICISFLIVAIIILSGIGIFLAPTPTRTEYLRIHIRAHSNEEIHQTVKYKVKEAVVNYLTPYISECNTKKDAEIMLNTHLNGIEKVADKVLKENGFSYKSSAGVREEEFPTRVYKDLTLDGGFYDALIIELGNGDGDNWWCVVYPPLCFTGEGAGYYYKSKIKEIIDDFFKKEKV